MAACGRGSQFTQPKLKIAFPRQMWSYLTEIILDATNHSDQTDVDVLARWTMFGYSM